MLFALKCVRVCWENWVFIPSLWGNQEPNWYSQVNNLVLGMQQVSTSPPF